ncbi:MAG: radical SAM/SPASM domain-containing protein [Patescibacteria group bacterium]
MKKTKAKLISQVSQERLELGKHIPFLTPLVVYVEPSGYCNLKCRFCIQKTNGKMLKKDLMSKALFLKMIDDIAEFPEKIKLLRVCGNGDPLINRDIIKMLQYAKKKKVAEKIELITNGIMLNENLIENLPKFLNRLVISIEGLSSEDYWQTSMAKINFDNLLNNISSLNLKKGKCALHIKIHNKAVFSENKKKKFLEIFDDKCDQIYIENLVPMWPQLDTDYFVDEFRWGGGKVIKRQVCAQIFKGVQVQADGDVVPCCVDWKRINILGNINKNSLSEIWKGEKLKELQIKHLTGNKGKVEPCKDCTMNDYCEFDNIDQYTEECIKRLCGKML